MLVPSALGPVIALVVLAAPPAPDPAEAKIGQATAAFAEADFDRAFELLDDAERLAASPQQLARVYRLVGILFDAVGQPLEALVRFTKALRADPGLGLDANRAKATTVRLYDCARALALAGTSEADVRRLLGSSVAETEWLCPITTPSVSAEPAPAQGPAVGPILMVAPPPADDRNLLWRWSFVIGGVAAAAGGLALDLGLDSGKDYVIEPVDFVGTSLMVIGLAAALTGLIAQPFDDSRFDDGALDDAGGAQPGGILGR